jgi:hypothetical protein
MLDRFAIELRTGGLDISSMQVEVFFKGDWNAIGVDTPFPVRKGSVISLRRKGVTRMMNWEIDSKFITD